MNDANTTQTPESPRRGAVSKFPPVGDIQIKKKSGTYNTYTWTLSYGQMEAIKNALEKDHSNPIADEMLAMLAYYIPNVPGPGEEEEDVKAREERAAIQQGGAEEEADGLIPPPPSEELDGGTTVAGEGPEEGGEKPVKQGGQSRYFSSQDLQSGEGRAGQQRSGSHNAPLPEPNGDDDVDSRLEAPPRE